MSLAAAHDLDGPLSKSQEARRREALNQLISGKAKAEERNGSKVVALKSRKGVTDWVKVPYNEARYGNNACGQTNCPSVWNVVSDGLNAWVAQAKAAGRTDA